jgi:hypothetical protein
MHEIAITFWASFMHEESPGTPGVHQATSDGCREIQVVGAGDPH